MNEDTVLNDKKKPIPPSFIVFVMVILTVLVYLFYTQVHLPMKRSNEEFQKSVQKFTQSNIPLTFDKLKLAQDSLTKYKTTKEYVYLMDSWMMLNSMDRDIPFEKALPKEEQEVIESFMNDIKIAQKSIDDARTLIDGKNDKDVKLAQIPLDEASNRLGQARSTLELLANKYQSILEKEEQEKLEKVREKYKN